jgi:hypothetical protein
MDEILGKIANAIQGFSNSILDYALLLAAVGTITMALLELIKAAFRIRLFFHRLMLRRWLAGTAMDEQSAAARLDELLQLAIGGAANADALYDQPTSKMLGQIQAAANVALDFPSVYSNLYDFLTVGSASKNNVSDSAKWKAFSEKISAAIPREGHAREAFEQESRESAQARARLGNLVTRKLDAFQTRVEYKWARINQIFAVVLGSAIFFFTLVNTKGLSLGTPYFTLLALSVLAGLFAPFAKDVVVALTGLRTRRT